jgi:hypothetical protein
VHITSVMEQSWWRTRLLQCGQHKEKIVLQVLTKLPYMGSFITYCPPLEPSRTRNKIIFIIPGLVAVESKHHNLTVPYYTCIYILNWNIITQSQGTNIFPFWCEHVIYLLFGTYIFPAWHSYVGSYDQLFYRCFFRLVCRFWFTSSTATGNSLA